MKKKTIAFGGLLLAVAITGYSVSGTYAKYISNVGFTDTARVAKWDFKLDSKDVSKTSNYDINLFEDSYLVTGSTTAKKVVSSEPGIKVVAPGTEGVYSFGVTGTAETNYTVSMNVSIDNEIKVTSGKTTYNPIMFSIDGGKTWMTDDKLKAALEKLYNPNTVYPANYALETNTAIQWKWDFEGDKTNNALDTELARLQKSITISVDFTVTQSDKAASKTIVTNTMVPILTKNVAASELAEFKRNGYDATKVADVKFNGKTLTGSIDLNDSDKLKAYFGNDATATGYYYPVALTGLNTGTKVYFGRAVKKEVTLTDADKGRVDFLFSIYPDEKDANKIIPIKIVVGTDAKGKEITKDITIDYSKLVFNK